MAVGVRHFSICSKIALTAITGYVDYNIRDSGSIKLVECGDNISWELVHGSVSFAESADEHLK
jgi:hypothetical protein